MHTRKVTLVTGGANGIGRCLVQHLLKQGGAVVAADTDREGGQDLLAYAGLGPVQFVYCDVADEKDVQRAVAAAVEQFGRLDGLVNNAGIADPENAPLESLSLESWHRTLSTNLTGAFLMAKHAAPHLRKARGAIVNVASTRALQAEPDTEAYSASKGGLVALGQALAISLGPDVRVNTILPGWIDVRAWQHGAGEVEPLRPIDHQQHPAGRVGRPEDVGALAHFLLYGESGFVTGAQFVVDGGMTRKMIYAE